MVARRINLMSLATVQRRFACSCCASMPLIAPRFVLVALSVGVVVALSGCFSISISRPASEQEQREHGNAIIEGLAESDFVHGARAAVESDPAVAGRRLTSSELKVVERLILSVTKEAFSFGLENGSEIADLVESVVSQKQNYKKRKVRRIIITQTNTPIARMSPDGDLHLDISVVRGVLYNGTSHISDRDLIGVAVGVQRIAVFETDPSLSVGADRDINEKLSRPKAVMTLLEIIDSANRIPFKHRGMVRAKSGSASVPKVMMGIVSALAMIERRMVSSLYPLLVHEQAHYLLQHPRPDTISCEQRALNELSADLFAAGVWARSGRSNGDLMLGTVGDTFNAMGAGTALSSRSFAEFYGPIYSLAGFDRLESGDSTCYPTVDQRDKLTSVLIAKLAVLQGSVVKSCMAEAISRKQNELVKAYEAGELSDEGSVSFSVTAEEAIRACEDMAGSEVGSKQ